MNARQNLVLITCALCVVLMTAANLVLSLPPADDFRRGYELGLKAQAESPEIDLTWETPLSILGRGLYDDSDPEPVGTFSSGTLVSLWDESPIGTYRYKVTGRKPVADPYGGSPNVDDMFGASE